MARDEICQDQSSRSVNYANITEYKINSLLVPGRILVADSPCLS